MATYHERYLNKQTRITIAEPVFDYWHRTERRTDGNAKILYIVLCDCCEVVFPSGRKRNAWIRCARCVRRGCQPNMRKCVRP